MSIISILITLCIIGVILWGVQQIPMDPTIKRIIVVVAIVLVLLWLLTSLSGTGPSVSFGHWR